MDYDNLSQGAKDLIGKTVFDFCDEKELQKLEIAFILNDKNKEEYLNETSKSLLTAHLVLYFNTIKDEQRANLARELLLEKATDELTAEMHYEFVADKISFEDFMVYSAFCALKDDMTNKDEVFKRYNVSETAYKKNIERVLKIDF